MARRATQGSRHARRVDAGQATVRGHFLVWRT
jgi:hypothetical protein